MDGSRVRVVMTVRGAVREILDRGASDAAPNYTPHGHDKLHAIPPTSPGLYPQQQPAMVEQQYVASRDAGHHATYV